MGDLALDVERLIAASAAEKRTQAQEGRNLFTETPSQEHAICISECSEIGKTSVEFDGAVAEPNSTRCPGEVLKKGGIECRICQEEDDLSNLETPCACSGTVKVCSASIPLSCCLPDDKGLVNRPGGRSRGYLMHLSIGPP